MKKAWILILVVCMMLVLPMTAYAENEVSIADAKLKNALRDLCGKGASDPLMPSELAALTGTVDLSSKGITNIRGIEYLTGATAIDLSHNDIDYETFSSKVSNLVKLEELDLSFNEQAYTFPTEVTKIPNLKTLNMAANKFTGLPGAMADMTALKSLNLSANRLEIFPDVLKELSLDYLNLDYNFFNLADGSADRKDIDEMVVTGEYLVYRQLLKLPAVTYATNGSKLKIKWYGLEDIPFYDGTYGTVAGYTILVNGAFVANVSASARSYEYDAVAGTKYRLAVSPSYQIEGYGNFDVRQYTTIEDCYLGSSGPELPNNPEPVLYENAYATPAPTPTPTPTPEPTPTPTPTPEPTAISEPSASPAAATGLFGASMLLTVVLLAVILLLIIVITVLLVVILRNKNIKGKNDGEEDEKK